MRLDFNVLWVDDQPGQLEEQMQAISASMREHGFEFMPTFVTSLVDVQARIGNSVFVDEVDLILVDWNLGKQLQGQTVIEEIRKEIPYKDIIFYSSYTDVQQLRGHAHEVGAEGVYCASKISIVNEVMAIFETLVKKVLDLDHTRGIVMGATSDIDQMVLECLASIGVNSGAEDQKKLLDKAKKIISKRIKDLSKKAQQLDSATEISVLLGADALLVANDRLRVLSAALASKEYDGHDTLRSGLSGYIQNVVPMRNELGHLVLVPAGRPVALTTLDGKEIGLEQMRALRCSLLDLRADFRKLRDSLAPMR